MSIPEGLTCGRCERALYPEVAKLRGEVYIHANRCPCLVADCERTAEAKGYCHPHYMKLRRQGDPLHANPRHVRIEIEDVEFLVETGENMNDAAVRLGAKSPAALDAYLRRHGRGDLATTLNARNPRDWNRFTEGGAVKSVDFLGDTYLVRAQRRNESRRQSRKSGAAA